MPATDLHSRRRPLRAWLKEAALLLGAAALPSLLAACAPAAVPAPPAAPAPAVQPAPPPAPAAPAPRPAAAVATGNVVAKEVGKNIVFEMDKLSVPTGNVHFTFKNTGKLSHDFWIYQQQDKSAYLAKKRAGETAKGRDYLKDATELFETEAGESKEADITLKPGLYEVSCFEQSKKADGSTYVHYDKAQHLTLEVTGPGFATRMEKPAKAMSVVANEWAFEPDTLLVAAGDVTFSFKNNGKMEHDFWVYPLQDRSEYFYRKLAGEAVKGRAFLTGSDELFELEAGETAPAKTMKLTPGTWATGCFILGKNEDGSGFIHADKGQIFTFTVK